MMNEKAVVPLHSSFIIPHSSFLLNRLWFERARASPHRGCVVAVDRRGHGLERGVAPQNSVAPEVAVAHQYAVAHPGAVRHQYPVAHEHAARLDGLAVAHDGA